MNIAIITPEIHHIINCIKIVCKNNGIKYYFNGIQTFDFDGFKVVITNKIRKISILWVKIDIYRDNEIPNLNYNRIYLKSSIPA